MTLHVDFRLRKKVLEKRIRYIIRVETEAVSSGVRLSSLRQDHSIVSSQRECQSSPKGLRKKAVVACDDAAALIDIILGKRYFLTMLDRLLVRVFDRQRLRLVAACPDHKVSLFNILLLVGSRRGFNQLDSLLFACFNAMVESPGITSEASETIEITILIGVIHLLELSVAILSRDLNLVVEHPDLVPIEDLDTRLWPGRQLAIVIVPLLVAEEAETLANA